MNAKESKPPKRVKPPTFSDTEKLIFPENAFLDLDGERPKRLDPDEIVQQIQNSKSNSSDLSTSRWSDWVEADILETEIKRQQRQLSLALKSPARFKSGSYRVADDSMGIISLLFAVTVLHDESPRWQDIAARLREAYATGENSLESDDESYQRAYQMNEDLTELIRGGRPSLAAQNKEIDWSRYASRGAIMRRMKLAHEDRLPTWVKDRREFSNNSDEIRHEAQLLALLAEAIVQPEAYDGEDEDYRAFARQLRDAANNLVIATEQEDQPSADQAFKRAQQSCVNCHADYRG